MPKRVLTSSTYSRPGRYIVAAGLTGVVVTALAVPSAAAIRGPATVAGAMTSSSCASAGVTFTVNARTRTCTTVTRQISDAQAVTSSTVVMSLSWPGGGAEHSLIGSSARRTTVETVVQRSQRPNRPVTVSTQSSTSSVVVPLSCTERRAVSQSGSYDRTTGTWIEGSHSLEDLDMPVTRCAEHRLYLA